MDDVPITLRPALESPYPSDEQVLTAIRERLMTLLAAGTHAAPGDGPQAVSEQ